MRTTGWIFILFVPHSYGLWTGILARKNGLKLKCLNDGVVSYKHIAFQFTTG